MTAIVLVIGLMVIGLGLVAIEAFIIPGVGLVGLMGAGAVFGSIYVAFTEFGGGFAAIILTGSVVVAGLVFWLTPRSRIGKLVVLETAITAAAVDETLKELLDREGTALTPLRPSGSVDIDDRPVDVVTDGQYVEQGTRVRVVRVEGARVVVEPVASA